METIPPTDLTDNEIRARLNAWADLLAEPTIYVRVEIVDHVLYFRPYLLEI